MEVTMPFIDSKISMKLTEDKKESIKRNWIKS